MSRKLNPVLTFANAYWWKAIENQFDTLNTQTGKKTPIVTESEIAEACGWKDARDTQFGNIFSRLADLGEQKLYARLKRAIAEINR